MMSEEDKKLLTELGPELEERVLIDDSRLLSQLLASGAITKYQREVITAEKTNTAKVSKLLYLLPKGNADAMNRFISSLQATGQKHVAELLLNLRDIKSELQRALGQKLLQWIPRIQLLIQKPANETTVSYVTLKVGDITGNRYKAEQPQEWNIQELLDQCEAEGRVIIYGEAGCGKTTALQHIAQCWLTEDMDALKVYDYVFLIPLRLVKSHSIEDIICLDCELLPKKFKESISRILALDTKRVLILLDSYEELAGCNDELKKVISRESCARATVLITSRPGSQLTALVPTPDIISHLQKLSVEDVKKYTACYSGGDGKTLFNMIEERFDMDFVERPINLALACYVCTSMDTASSHRISQTQMFSRIVAQLLTIYIGKTSCLDPKTVSFQSVLDVFKIDDIRFTGTKAFFLEICKQCLEALQRKSQWLSTVNGNFTANDFISFGLFFRGTTADTVDLSHRLFQEFLAAVYLVRDVQAWQKLDMSILKKARRPKSLSRRPLADVLCEEGLENVIKFVVGLSASRAEELCSLFVIKQMQPDFLGVRTTMPVYSYELELLQECSEEQVKLMASALSHAPVSITNDTRFNALNKIDGKLLLNTFSDAQSRQFLVKAYGCKVTGDQSSGQVTKLNIKSDKVFVFDSFVVGFLQKFPYTALEMSPYMVVLHSEIPVDLLPFLASGVSQWLRIENCTLLPARGTGTRGDVSIGGTASPKVCVSLNSVRGRRPFGSCHGTASNVGNLELTECGDVNIPGLTQTFTQMERMQVDYGTLVYSGDFEQVDTMSELRLDFCGEVKLCQLVQMFPQLTVLVIRNCLVSCSDIPSHCQWQLLQKLELFDCGEVRLSQWQRLCPNLKTLWTHGSSLPTVVPAFCVDDVATPWQSLERLSLLNSHVEQKRKWLTEDEAGQTLEKVCHSATIFILYYRENLQGLGMIT